MPDLQKPDPKFATGFDLRLKIVVVVPMRVRVAVCSDLFVASVFAVIAGSWRPKSPPLTNRLVPVQQLVKERYFAYITLPISLMLAHTTSYVYIYNLDLSCFVCEHVTVTHLSM